jgi:hypothetical protein
MLKLIEQGQVRVLISGFYPFSRLKEAFEDLELRHARGKVIVGMHAVTGDNTVNMRMRDWYSLHPDRELVLT